MTKKFSLDKYIVWAKKHYAPRKDVVHAIEQQIKAGTHYACHLDGRTISQIKREGWSVLDDWIIEV